MRGLLGRAGGWEDEDDVEDDGVVVVVVDVETLGHAAVVAGAGAGAAERLFGIEDRAGTEGYQRLVC